MNKGERISRFVAALTAGDAYPEQTDIANHPLYRAFFQCWNEKRYAATVSASFGVQNKELATPAPTIHKKIGAEQMATQVPKANAVPSHRRF
jgi:hypothetical protein